MPLELCFFFVVAKTMIFAGNIFVAESCTSKGIRVFGSDNKGGIGRVRVLCLLAIYSTRALYPFLAEKGKGIERTLCWSLPLFFFVLLVCGVLKVRRRFLFFNNYFVAHGLVER